MGRGEQQWAPREEEGEALAALHPQGVQGGPGLAGHVPAHWPDAPLRSQQKTHAEGSSGPSLLEEIKNPGPQQSIKQLLFIQIVHSWTQKQYGSAS